MGGLSEAHEWENQGLPMTSKLETKWETNIEDQDDLHDIIENWK